MISQGNSSMEISSICLFTWHVLNSIVWDTFVDKNAWIVKKKKKKQADEYCKNCVRHLKEEKDHLFKLKGSD